MECPNCQRQNDPNDNFCGSCGNKLDRECSECGEALKPSKKFCTNCGTAVTTSRPATTPAKEITREVADYTPKHLADKILQSRSALEGERKQVTVLFADIKGSMDLTAKVDPEDWHEILDQFFSILTSAVHRYEGTVNQYTGDGIMALFGAPIAHEDHGQRACYAALQMLDELRSFSVKLRMERRLDFGVRIGINSGTVVVGKIGDDLRMDYTAQGQTVGIAQRLEQLAEAGHVYLSEHTARLVEGFFELTDLGASRLSETGSPIGVFELSAPTEVRSRLQASHARGLTQFVGRSDEMHTLNGALERAREGHGQVVGVVGEPGLGKSRLCFEFVETCRQNGIPVYDCHCPSYGKTIPFIPILELFRKYFGISERDAPQEARRKIAGTLVLLDPALQEGLPILFDFLGIGDPDRPAPAMDAEVRQRRMFDMLHRVIRAQSELGQVTVTLVDDLHWIDSWSDSFVAQMVEAIEHSHSLLLVNFRPEYQAAWSNKPHYQQLPLVPLGREAVHDLVSSLLGDDPSIRPLAERIMEWTTGNPLYSEEIINLLVETGQVDGTRGAYRLVKAVTDLEVPATVQAIIAARIDRLGETEKSLLHAASVIGKEFSKPVLELVAELTAEQQSSALQALKNADFIYETAIFPTIEYAFKHPLVHEVAYEAQLREQREYVHAGVARALEVVEAARLDEFSSTLAYHWEQAKDAEQALLWYRRAAVVDGLQDAPSALNHWRKVRELVDRLPTTPEILNIGAEACGQMSQLYWRVGATEDEARAYFEDGIALAERAENVPLKAVLTGTYSIMRGVSMGYANDYERFGTEALKIAEQTGNADLECTMQNWIVFGRMFKGRFAAAIELAGEMLLRLESDPSIGAGFVGTDLRWSVAMGTAMCSFHVGDTSKSREFSTMSRQYTNDVVDIIIFTDVMAAMREAICGTDDKVLDDLGATLSEAERTGSGYARSGAHWVMGIAHYHAGNYTAAAEWSRSAIDIMNNENTGRAHLGSAIGTYALSEVSSGNATLGRDLAREAIDFCSERELYWQLTPWLALAEAYVALGEREAAGRAIADTQDLINRTGGKIWQPFLHEIRARHGEHFDSEWERAAEIAEAKRLFAEVEAFGQVARLDLEH